MGQADPARIALGRVKIQPEGRALGQLFLATGETAHAQLRPLQIRQDGDRAVQILFDLADDLVTCTDIVMGAVAHVQTEHIRTGLVQGADHRIVIR